jgi:hypothetical protein
MYSTRTGLVLGFHGCDESLVNEVVSGKVSLKQSENVYDWLGNGIYFWENSPSRALEFAEELKRNPAKSNSSIRKPAVLGAILNLGFCLDLLDYENLQLLKEAFLTLKHITEESKFPQNKFVGTSKDLMLRELDCAVIATLHQIRRENNLKEFDSIKGVFWEGKELYPNAGFKEKDHIQICIRNPNCIKGYFIPRELDEKYPRV